MLSRSLQVHDVKYIAMKDNASSGRFLYLWSGCTIDDSQSIGIFTDRHITLKSPTRRGKRYVCKHFRARFLTPLERGAPFSLHTRGTCLSSASERTSSTTSGCGATGSGAYRSDIRGVEAYAMGPTNSFARRPTNTDRCCLDVIAYRATGCCAVCGPSSAHTVC